MGFSLFLDIYFLVVSALINGTLITANVDQFFHAIGSLGNDPTSYFGLIFIIMSVVLQFFVIFWLIKRNSIERRQTQLGFKYFTMKEVEEAGNN